MRMILRVFLLLASSIWASSIWAADINLTWDNVPDARVQFTVIERCAGTQIQCDAVGANWGSSPIGQVDLPANTFTDTGLPENTNASYRAGYGNVDFPNPTNWSNVVGVRVPFADAPSAAPANLGVQ